MDNKSIQKNVFRSTQSFTKLKNRWQSENRSIVLTMGVFDLLHFGHETYLRKAANLGDRLVVCLDSDIKVRHRKGSSRPILTFQERADAVSQLSYVDAVLEFQLNITNRKLLRAIKPNIFVVSSNQEVSIDALSRHLPFIKKIVEFERTSGISTTNIAKEKNGSD